ncbi:Wd-40 repeat protein [Mycena venus]|uniref:Wd-40 repeat protein n=1 Tax=Mycena venus TaxID=2733690 RepID=A0A8H6XR75_9AGAR|nr:Wd-40 repeat protein [Mycena venus]
MPTPAEFFATWKHSLSSDFQQDGVPAETNLWVTETAKIAMNGETRAAVLNDDGSLLATGADHEVYVYDMATLRLVRTFRGHAGYKIGGLEFQPAGRKIAASLSGQIPQEKETVTMVRVWDLDGPPEPPSDHLDDAANAAMTAASLPLLRHWSVDDLESVDLKTEIAELIASGQAAVDVRSGRVLLGQLPSFGSRAFSPDGRSLLYFPDRHNVAVLDVDTFTVRFHLSGHTDAVMWAETSPNNKVVATSSWDKTVRIWSMDSGEVIHILEGATIQSWGGAFSPDGRLIAAGAGDKMVRIWRVDTGELLHTLSGFSRWIRSLSFSPDSLHLAAGAAGGTLRVFEVGSGACKQVWQIDISTHRFARSYSEISDVQYTRRGDLFFRSTEGRIFGYRARDNSKWEYAGESYPY